MTHTALVFPGQGSQKVGMLAELAEHFAVVRNTFAEASAALSQDLWAVVQGQTDADDQPLLDQTAFTQPVLLTAGIALWRLWQESGGVKPACLAGHSLGEYTALTAAEALSLSDAVRLVQHRGQLMQQAVPLGAGSMAALLGLTDEQVTALCQTVAADTGQTVVAANFNAPGQVVVAGASDAVKQVIQKAREQGGKALPVPVSVPSHSPLMQQTAEQFESALQQVSWQMPVIPVIHNVDAQVALDLDGLKQRLVAQLAQPVLWTQTMQACQTNYQITRLVECGPGTVLTNLAKRAAPPIESWPLDSRDRLEAALAAVNLAEGKLV